MCDCIAKKHLYCPHKLHRDTTVDASGVYKTINGRGSNDPSIIEYVLSKNVLQSIVYSEDGSSIRVDDPKLVPQHLRDKVERLYNAILASE